jgi:carboxymethylenebutenolidase
MADHTGTTVEFPSNGTKGSGYLSVPASGAGPGVVVIQEWWGINDQIKEVCDRWAREGFVALAPDLYRGKVTTEPDEAQKLMMSMNLDQAAKDMVGAVDFLTEHEAVTSDGVGVVGYCMGGALALKLGTLRTTVRAVAPYYGVIGWPAPTPDWSKLEAPVQGHYAENDDFASPEAVAKLSEELRGLGKTVEVFTYADTEHAFTNHHRPEVHHGEATELAWQRTIEFFREHVT